MVRAARHVIVCHRTKKLADLLPFLSLRRALDLHVLHCTTAQRRGLHVLT